MLKKFKTIYGLHYRGKNQLVKNGQTILTGITSGSNNYFLPLPYLLFSIKGERWNLLSYLKNNSPHKKQWVLFLRYTTALKRLTWD